jgi:hypothetical protein
MRFCGCLNHDFCKISQDSQDDYLDCESCSSCKNRGSRLFVVSLANDTINIRFLEQAHTLLLQPEGLPILNCDYYDLKPIYLAISMNQKLIYTKSKP